VRGATCQPLLLLQPPLLLLSPLLPPPLLQPRLPEHAPPRLHRHQPGS
jgi:hypothetical protein